MSILRRWPVFGPLLLLLLIVAGSFWQLVFSAQFSVFDGPDPAAQVLPWYQVQARLWQAGEFPLWDPYAYGGQPLLGQMQPGAAFPPNWPLFLAPLKHGFIDLRFVHWHYVLMHLLAAWFMYGLARELGRGRYASLFAGAAFAVTGYLSVVPWPQMLHGAMWAPLSFLLLLRAARFTGLRRAREAALCGLSVGLSVLSGHHQAPLYSLLGLGAFFLFLLAPKLRSGRRQASAWIGAFALTGVVAFLIAAPQLFPALEYAADAVRWIGLDHPVSQDDRVPLFIHERFGLPAGDLFRLVVPITGAENPFVGFTVLTLAVFGLGAWRRPHARFFAGLSLGALLLALATQTVFYGWIYAWLPMIEQARSPARFVLLFQFAVIVLAAFGVDRLRATVRARRRGQTKAFGGLVVAARSLLTAAVAAAVVLLLARGLNFDAYLANQLSFAGLAAALLALFFFALRVGVLRGGALKLGLLAMLLLEAGALHRLYIVEKTDPARQHFLERLYQPAGPIAFLNKQPKPFRFEIVTDEQRMNLGAWHGLEDVMGYLASLTRGLYEIGPAVGWEGQRLLNPVFTVAKAPVRPQQSLVFSDAGEWKVFRNPDASPRAWIDRTAQAIEGADPLPACPADASDEKPIEWLHWSEQRSRLRVRLACPAYLIFSEPDLPGWRVTADGLDLPVLSAHGALRAVRLEAGVHELESTYAPSSVRLGAALSIVGLAVVLGLCLVARRRSVPTPKPA